MSDAVAPVERASTEVGPGRAPTAPAEGRWLAIVNPAAGRFRGRNKWARMEDALRRAAVPLDVITTLQPGDGEAQAARAITAGRRKILVGGGDGSVHDAVNGIMNALEAADPCSVLGRRPTLVPLPLGTGNDWARSLSLPHDPARLAAIVAADRGAAHDVGQVVFPSRDGEPEYRRWFINVAGAGLDAHVIAKLPVQTPSGFAYLAGALRELRRYRSPLFRVLTDGGSPREGRFLLAFVANAQYCGHRMHVAPTARMDDGALDIVTINEVGLLRALPKLVKLYGGTILRDPVVTHEVAASVRIEAEPAAAVEADGQLVGHTPAVFSVKPGALQVLRGP